jgi:anti-anti-sigma regulatory factor
MPGFETVFDMVEVTDLGDSGINWLRIFVDWAQQTDVGICVINLHPRLVQRLEDAGIELVDGEPVLRKKPGKSRRVASDAASRAFAVN